MPFRMLDYRVRGYRRFPHKQMRQVVIYLRKTASPLITKNDFRLEKTYHEFEVIRLWEQPTERFLTVPGLLPFAVLSQTKDLTMVLTQVAQAVEAITDQRLQSNIAAASAVLAGILLQKDVISRILRSEIMRESVIYQAILQEGKAEITRKVAVNLLRIGMSLDQIAQVSELSLEQVQALQREIESL